MEILSASLPNVMFIVGIVAISIGLGIELKVVPVGNKVGRSGRIGAITVGIMLVIVSVVLYIRPSQTAASSVPTASVLVASTAVPANAAPVLQPTVAAPPDPTAQSTVAVAAPTPAAPVGVSVPDLTGKKIKDVQDQLGSIGLVFGTKKGSCAELGVPASSSGKGPKDRILCQKPAPGSVVPPGTTVDYASTGD